MKCCLHVHASIIIQPYSTFYTSVIRHYESFTHTYSPSRSQVCLMLICQIYIQPAASIRFDQSAGTLLQDWVDSWDKTSFIHNQRSVVVFFTNTWCKNTRITRCNPKYNSVIINIIICGFWVHFEKLSNSYSSSLFFIWRVIQAGYLLLSSKSCLYKHLSFII